MLRLCYDIYLTEPNRLKIFYPSAKITLEM